MERGGRGGSESPHCGVSCEELISLRLQPLGMTDNWNTSYKHVIFSENIST